MRKSEDSGSVQDIVYGAARRKCSQSMGIIAAKTTSLSSSTFTVPGHRQTFRTNLTIHQVSTLQDTDNPKCDVFSTVHHSIELFHQPTLMHNFLYSLTICLLHYYPRHVSSINMPIFRRKSCIHTASSIFALCKLLHSTLVESRLPLKMGMLMLETCRG